jgi:hypothetical protein
MGEITVLHGWVLSIKLLHHCCHIHRIPDGDRAGDQIETQRMMGQRLSSTLPALALVHDHQSSPYVVECFAFVQLAQEAAPILRVGIPPQDMQRAGEAAILLKGAGQHVLLGMGLRFRTGSEAVTQRSFMEPATRNNSSYQSRIRGRLMGTVTSMKPDSEEDDTCAT